MGREKLIDYTRIGLEFVCFTGRILVLGFGHSTDMTLHTNVILAMMPGGAHHKERVASVGMDSWLWVM